MATGNEDERKNSQPGNGWFDFSVVDKVMQDIKSLTNKVGDAVSGVSKEKVVQGTLQASEAYMAVMASDPKSVWKMIGKGAGMADKVLSHVLVGNISHALKDSEYMAAMMNENDIYADRARAANPAVDATADYPGWQKVVNRPLLEPLRLAVSVFKEGFREMGKRDPDWLVMGHSSNLGAREAKRVMPVLTAPAERARRLTQKEIVDFFIENKWQPHQAAGIASGILAESGNDHLRTGSNGAYGLGAWNPERQETFKRVYGKDMRDASAREQLAFIQYELVNSRASSGRTLKMTQDAKQAGRAMSGFFNRPDLLDEYGLMGLVPTLPSDWFNPALWDSWGHLKNNTYERNLKAHQGAESAEQINQTINISVSGATDPYRTADVIVSALKNEPDNITRNFHAGML